MSVAIGELTDGGLGHLSDRVPTKYDGLNATELAISESQERMAVVVERAEEEFKRYCAEENIEVTHVADVTDYAPYADVQQSDQVVVDLSREFIDSAGAKALCPGRDRCGRGTRSLSAAR